MKKKFRSILCVTLASALVLSGCGGSASTSNEGTGDAAAEAGGGQASGGGG